MGSTESIFNSIKKLLGTSYYDNGFDSDIMDFINAEFLTLYQLGVIPDASFTITGPETTWKEAIPDPDLRSAARTFIFHNVKKQFDPSGSSTVNEMTADVIAEKAFRLNLQAEGGDSGE